MDWKNWADRKFSRGRSPDPAPAPSTQPQYAPPPAAQAAQTLPPAPSGYAWAAHATAGWILVPLGGGATPASISAPLRAPGTVPYVAQVHRVNAPAPVETCTLVKQGDRDTYAELLATLPDLVSPSGFDAMSGRPSPLVQQELSGLAEFHDVGFAADPSAPAISFPRGAPQPGNKIKDLSSANLPPPPPDTEGTN